MNSLKSLALIALFVGNAFLTRAQDQKGDGPYYSEAQRQRIHQTLTTAKPTDNPVSKKLTHEPKPSADTVSLGDLKDTKALGYRVSTLKKMCTDSKATQISYKNGDNFYSVSIADIEELENNYNNLHRELKLPHETDTRISVENTWELASISNDTTSATFIASFHTLENISLKALKSFQAHETGHSFFNYRELMEKLNEPKPLKGELYVPKKPRKHANAYEEYVSDSIQTVFDGAGMIEAMEELAGYLNKNVDEGNTSKKEAKNITELTYRFHKDYKDGYPSLGQRIQYAEALIQHAENQDMTEKPELPPIVKGWQPPKPTEN